MRADNATNWTKETPTTASGPSERPRSEESRTFNRSPIGVKFPKDKRYLFVQAQTLRWNIGTAPRRIHQQARQASDGHEPTPARLDEQEMPTGWEVHLLGAVDGDTLIYQVTGANKHPSPALIPPPSETAPNA